MWATEKRASLTWCKNRSNRTKVAGVMTARTAVQSTEPSAVAAGSRLPNTTSIEFDPGATALGSVHPKIPVLHYERCGRLAKLHFKCRRLWASGGHRFGRGP